MDCEICGVPTNRAIQTQCAGPDVYVCDDSGCEAEADRLANDIEAEADDRARQEAERDDYDRYRY